jgi:O-succinylbenzoic acid--CoA ligase
MAQGTRLGLFTSGTTGAPRLVEIGERHLRASAAANGAVLGDDPAQRWLLTLPMFHVGGLALAHRCAVYGACVVLEPGFDAARAASALAGGVTHASLVATMLQRVLAERGDRRFRGVRAVLVGGGPAPSTLTQGAAALGLPVLQTYGLTEATSQVATERPGEADGTTCGPGLPGLELRVVDEGGVDAEPGQEGEIRVRGPTVTRPGWLATGDVGRVDARGRLTVLARRVDVVLRGGENIYPLEVEAALREHPEVIDAAVVPVPDAEWGQVPHAFVVSNGPLDCANLEAFLSDRLARFKVPRRWEAIAALPRNAMGKVDRTALRASLSPSDDQRQSG